MVHQPSRRAERRPVESSRSAILDATESLLLEMDADLLSIRAVSARCGYQAPTIYHHFGDKNGLIQACIEVRFGELLRGLERVPEALDPAQYLRDLARAFVRFGVEHPAHYRLLAAPPPGAELSPSSEKARALVENCLDRLSEQGRLRTANSRTAFQATWALLHGLITLSISRPDYDWNDELIECAFDVLEDGLYLKGSSA